jgi:P27 family predicted phage terminase small subunit
MTQGRRKKPSALRIVGARPDEPQPTTLRELPPCPAYLTGAAAEEWARASDELISVGILTDLDLPLLGTWCQQFKIWRSCVETLNEAEAADPVSRGVVVRSPSGAAYQNPVVGALNAAAREMRRLGQELGLSPSGRAGMTVPKRTERGSDIAARYRI